MNSHPSARRRDRYQVAVTALTGLTTAACLTATGWLAGQAAQNWAADQAATPATNPPVDPAASTPQSVATTRQRARPARPRVVLRPRPLRTRVSTRYVTPAAPIGGGGSVGSTPSQPTHSNPAPAPAPSSGS